MKLSATVGIFLDNVSLTTKKYLCRLQQMFETFKSAQLVTAICVTVIVNEEAGKTQAICRFFLPNGTFLGEVPQTVS